MEQQEVQDTIRHIKSELRLAMNGIASSYMRENGMDYKLNFGVEIPRLRTIAEEFPHDHQLAQALWKENIRECKLLAGMLQPMLLKKHSNGLQTNRKCLRFAVTLFLPVSSCKEKNLMKWPKTNSSTRRKAPSTALPKSDGQHVPPYKNISHLMKWHSVKENIF